MGVRSQRVLMNRIHAGEDGDSHDGIEFNPVLLVSSGDEGIREAIVVFLFFGCLLSSCDSFFSAGE